MRKVLFIRHQPTTNTQAKGMPVWELGVSAPGPGTACSLRWWSISFHFLCRVWLHIYLLKEQPEHIFVGWVRSLLPGSQGGISQGFPCEKGKRCSHSVLWVRNERAASRSTWSCIPQNHGPAGQFIPCCPVLHLTSSDDSITSELQIFCWLTSHWWLETVMDLAHSKGTNNKEGGSGYF